MKSFSPILFLLLFPAFVKSQAVERYILESGNNFRFIANVTFMGVDFKSYSTDNCNILTNDDIALLIPKDRDFVKCLVKSYDVGFRRSIESAYTWHDNEFSIKLIDRDTSFMFFIINKRHGKN